MSSETGKAVFRRSFDRRYVNYLAGDGIDIGSGDDPLDTYRELFPLMTSCRSWDQTDGDAEFVQSVGDNTFDFVHSSHCLEHLHSPWNALKNWIRICKPGGYLVITVPDEDLYEQGVWPSMWAGSGHKWSFTIGKLSSWAPNTLNLLIHLQDFVSDIEVLKIEKLDMGFLKKPERFDQTRTMIGECAIEMVLRKRNVNA